MNGLDWQCYLAGSSKTAPRILIFSIAMGADYSFEVKNIKIWLPAFFKHNNSSVATMHSILSLLVLAEIECTVRVAQIAHKTSSAMQAIEGKRAQLTVLIPIYTVQLS